VTWHRDVGEGPALVLLHGGTGDPESYWSPQLPVLSQHFRLILTQYPGYGDEAGGDAPFSIPSCAAHVCRLLDELGVERASLVGLSLGGAVSLQFALDYPARVRRLVLADTMSGVWTQKFRRFIDHALIGAIEQGGHDLMFELNLIFAFSERYLGENEALFDPQKQAWRSMDVARYTAMLRAIRDWSVDERLGEIEAPALVLWGSEDIEIPRVYSERLASALPHAILSVIEGSGHKSCADRPEAFNKAVLAFLLEGS
jgi:pimeloyl-ACP methyl ester carboxylesterase